MNITDYTALELGKKIKSGDITVVEATRAFLDEIKAKDGVVNAYITVTEQEALERAEEVQKMIDSGELSDSPLAGVPVGIKDNISTKGIKTSCASKILGDFKPPYNAAVIDKLNKAGAVIIGKLNMDEFAMGSTSETSFYGPTKTRGILKRFQEVHQAERLQLFQQRKLHTHWAQIREEVSDSRRHSAALPE